MASRVSVDQLSLTNLFDFEVEFSAAMGQITVKECVCIYKAPIYLTDKLNSIPTLLSL